MPSLGQTVSFILNHPGSQGRKAQNIARFIGWQIYYRLTTTPLPFAFVNGTKLLASRGLHTATGNLYVGLYEYQEMSYLLAKLKPGDLFVDVGANIGAYSILAASCGASVIAFEPDPCNFTWLQRNIALNGFGHKIEAIPQAVGASCGKVRLTADGCTSKMSPNGETFTEMTTLDSALAERRATAIKIDVEGYETAVLDGAHQVLSHTQMVIAEINELSTFDRLVGVGFKPQSDVKSGNLIFTRSTDP